MPGTTQTKRQAEIQTILDQHPEGISAKEIAELLNVKISTVYGLLSRMKKTKSRRSIKRAPTRSDSSSFVTTTASSIREELDRTEERAGRLRAAHTALTK